VSEYVALYELYFQNPQAMEDSAKDDLEINRTLIQDALSSQPGVYYKWARLAAIGEARAASAKYHAKEAVYPKLVNFYRDNLPGKVTEAKIEAAALSSDEYQQALASYIKLEEIAVSLRSMERAMAQRLEMLRSINSRIKAELNNE
jgi:hypothetical protein